MRLQEKSPTPVPVVYKRGTSVDYSKKLPEAIEKLIIGKDKISSDSEFETSFAKNKNITKQTYKKMTKTWDVKVKPKGPQTSRNVFPSNNQTSRIENHLFTSTIRPAHTNRLSADTEPQSLQERQPNIKSKLPDIHKKSDKKLRSSVVFSLKKKIKIE